MIKKITCNFLASACCLLSLNLFGAASSDSEIRIVEGHTRLHLLKAASNATDIVTQISDIAQHREIYVMFDLHNTLVNSLTRAYLQALSLKGSFEDEDTYQGFRIQVFNLLAAAGLIDPVSRELLPNLEESLKAYRIKQESIDSIKSFLTSSDFSDFARDPKYKLHQNYDDNEKIKNGLYESLGAALTIKFESSFFGVPVAHQIREGLGEIVAQLKQIEIKSMSICANDDLNSNEALSYVRKILDSAELIPVCYLDGKGTVASTAMKFLNGVWKAKRKSRFSRKKEKRNALFVYIDDSLKNLESFKEIEIPEGLEVVYVHWKDKNLMEENHIITSKIWTDVLKTL